MRSDADPLAPDTTIRLDGRVVLITGAAGDIGAAIAVHAWHAGARVALLDRDAAALEAVVAQRFGDDARVLQLVCDIADPQQVVTAVEAVVRHWQQLHVLVNNAAAATPSAPIADAALDDWQRSFDVNVTGAWLMAKSAIPQMARAGGGVVLNIASQLGQVAVAGRGVYGVSKAALIAMARAIAVDHAAQGIRALSLSPGAVMTQRLTDRYGSAEQVAQTLASRYPLQRIGTPDEVARLAVFMVSDAAAFVTGSDWLADGGYTAV